MANTERQITVILQHFVRETSESEEETHHFEIDFDDALMLCIQEHIGEYINRFHNLPPLTSDFELNRVEPIDRSGRAISTRLIFDVISRGV